MTIVVEPKKTGTLSNTATVISPQDTTPTNNQATATTVVNETNDLLNGGGSRHSCKGGAGRDTLKRCP